MTINKWEKEYFSAKLFCRKSIKYYIFKRFITVIRIHWSKIDRNVSFMLKTALKRAKVDI